MAQKIRLDHLLVQRGLAESTSRAQALILAWQVKVDGQILTKPGTRILSNAAIEVDRGLPFVSRGGLKLAAALDAFQVSVTGKTCADVGASTGGFTDCLLQRGAARVYAIDVGYGQLAWKLRQHERVVNMERTNARYVERLPESVDLVTMDASFISLNRLFPAVVGWLAPNACVIPLVKPQFEAGRQLVGKGGVVRDAAVHWQVLERVSEQATEHGLHVWDLIRSPITGPAGNIEFLLLLKQASPPKSFDLAIAIKKSLLVEEVETGDKNADLPSTG